MRWFWSTWGPFGAVLHHLPRALPDQRRLALLVEAHDRGQGVNAVGNGNEMRDAVTAHPCGDGVGRPEIEAKHRHAAMLADLTCESDKGTGRLLTASGGIRTRVRPTWWV